MQTARAAERIGKLRALGAPDSGAFEHERATALRIADAIEASAEIVAERAAEIAEARLKRKREKARTIVNAVRELPLLFFNKLCVKVDLLEIRRLCGRDIELFLECAAQYIRKSATGPNDGQAVRAMVRLVEEIEGSTQ